MVLALRLLAATTDPVPDPNSAALYAAVSAVLVALIGGVVAVLTSRYRQPDRPSARALEEPTTHALPRELADMLVEVIAERDAFKVERDVWKARAESLGWKR